MKKKKLPTDNLKKKDAGHNKSLPPLTVCTNAPHAEMARNKNKDEPCDDGREG